jgi:hypothetical protein
VLIDCYQELERLLVGCNRERFEQAKVKEALAGKGSNKRMHDDV